MTVFTKLPPTLFLLLGVLQGWMNLRGSALIFHPALYRNLESIQQHSRGVAAGRGCTLVTTRLATDLSAPPRSFLKRSIIGMTKATTTRSKRHSSLSLSSSSHQESSSENTLKKKKTTIVKKIKKPSSPNTTATTSDDTPNDGLPWYDMFTKGDKEYDQYMATEWGFEKVKRIRRVHFDSFVAKFPLSVFPFFSARNGEFV